MSSPQPSVLSPRFLSARFVIAAVAIVVAVAWTLAPGTAGDWGRDDYFQLAFVRMVGSPWPFFVHDHFPVPGSIFRPLGFASMRLGFDLFGTDYVAHAWSGVVLHALVALALHAVLRRARIGEPAALLATLAFALHPAATGPALWWSARFDVLAALFTLLALRAAIAYRDQGAPFSLAAALVAAFAAMLSKEVGLVAVAAIATQWTHWAIVEPAQRRRALRAIVAALACAVAYFAWRMAVLGTPASGLTGGLPLGDAFAKGIADGLRQMPAYLTFWPRLPVSGRAVLALAGLFALGVLVWGRAAWRADAATLACGAVVLLAPLLLQAPVAALNARALDSAQSVVETAMQSRLYYTGLGGIAMIFAVVLDRVWRGGTPLRHTCLLAIATFVGLGIAAASHQDARTFAERTARNARLAHAAVTAVDALDLSSSACHVVFLGVEPPPEWSTYVSMDAIVKAIDTDHARTDRCWFHVGYPTWFFLQPASAKAADAVPYEVMRIDGRALPWRDVGGATIAYLQAPRELDAAARARLHWLRWNGRGFDDVGADVAAGRLPVDLRVP